MLISTRQYAKAHRLLDSTEKLAHAVQRRIQSRIITLPFPSKQITATRAPPSSAEQYRLQEHQPLCLRFDHELAAKLRTHNFEAFLNFEYLDRGQQEFRIVTDPARPDTGTRPDTARLYSEVARIKKDNTGQ